MERMDIFCVAVHSVELLLAATHGKTGYTFWPSLYVLPRRHGYLFHLEGAKSESPVLGAVP